ncbi:MAG: response regulator [Cytophagales bacterium]|nr:response regulator [Cytophagales bacterium]
MEKKKLPNLWEGLPYEDLTTEAIFVLDSEGCFQYMNKILSQRLGYSKSEWEGLSIKKLLPQEEEYLSSQHGSKEQFQNRNLTLLTKHGRKIFLRGHIIHESHGLRGFFKDVTTETRILRTQEIHTRVMDFNASNLPLEILYQRIFEEVHDVFNIEYLGVVHREKKISREASFSVFGKENLKDPEREVHEYICQHFSQEVLSRRHSLIVLNTSIRRVVEARYPKVQTPHMWMGVNVPFQSKKIETVLSFYSFDQKTRYSPRELGIIEFLGKQVSVALERKIRQSQLKSKEARLFSIYESNSHQIWTVDSSYKLTDFNPLFEEVFSQSIQKPIRLGNDFMEILKQSSKSLSPDWIKYLNRAFEGHSTKFRTYLAQEDGKNVWLDVFLNPIYSSKKKVNEVSCIANDITHLKKITDELVQSKEKAEQLLQAKQNFLANMSHEIRTPINGMMGMLELLNSTNLNPAQKEYLDIIKTSSATLMSILNDILNLSKIEAGKLELYPKPLRFREMLIKSLSLYEKQGSQVFLHVDPEVPNHLCLDETRIGQILSNMISNAIKFSEYRKEVHVGVYLASQKKGQIKLRIKVKDYGIGISPEEQKDLFKSFHQLERSTRKRFGGTGLGLAITKNLALLMKGDMGVFSTPSQGSCFWIDLWVQEAKVEEIESLKSEKGEILTQPKLVQQVKILLVDDNLSNLRVAQSFLEKAEAQVISVQDGRSALEQVGQHIFDLILMDIQMPIMDGIDTAKEIRKKRIHVPPIIAMTAYAMPEDKEKFLDLGMDDYIPKPISYSGLIQKVIYWTQKSKTPSHQISKPKPYPTQASPKKNAQNDQDIWDQNYVQKVVLHGGKKAYLEAFQDFKKEIPPLLLACQEDMKRAQFKELSEHVHKIKGAAGSVGIICVQRSCLEIEQQILQENPPSLDSLQESWKAFLAEEQKIRNSL